MTSRRTVVAALAGCALALSACTSGGTTTSSTSATGSEADVVAWVDKVCGAIGGTMKSMDTEPQMNLNDPAALKNGLSAWLGTQVTAAEKSVTDLKALENGPHPKSKELVVAAENGMNDVKTLLADTKKKVESSADATQVIAAFTEMMTKAAAFDSTGADVRKKFDDSGLGDATKKAANCKQLETSPSSAPTS